MAIISRLAVLLGLDAGEFNANLGKAKDKVEGFSLGAKVSLATVAVAFTATARSALQFADQVAEVAKANDMSIQSVLRMSEALTVNGGKAEDAGKLMSAFNNKIDEAAQGSEKAQKAFQSIGISINDLKHLSPERLWEKTVQQLALVEDSTKRNAMAMDIFGRAIKGVDVKGFADQLQRNKDAYADAEKAFDKVNQGFDNLALLTQKLKTDTAKDIGDFFELVTRKALESYDAISKVIAAQKELATNSRITPATFATPQGLISTFGLTLIDKQIKKAKDLKSEIASLTYSPIDTALGPDFRTGKNTHNRDVKDPNADKIQKQNEALRQQIALYNFQAASVGMVRSEYEKLNLEFAKGGKFSDVNAKVKADAQKAALALDKAIQNDFIQGEIRKADLAKDRFRIEGLMAGQSDNAKLKAREYLQIQEEILEIRRTQVNISDQDIAKIAEAKIAMVEMADASRRANNTFQAGFSSAYENFKEQATDSFSAGENAFTSMTSNMESALDNFVRTGKLSFSDLARSIISDLIAIQLKAQALQMFEGLKGLFGFGGGGGGGSGMFTAITGAIGGSIHIGAKANGGDVIGGMPYLVGEQGPELVVPRNNGTVIPNHSLSSMMGSQPQVVYNGPYIQNMSAIDTQSSIQFLSRNKDAVWAANQSAQRSLPQTR